MMRFERIRAHRVAEMTGIAIRRVQAMALAGKIPSAAKFGDVWTFDPKAICRWIKDKEREVECRNLISTNAKGFGMPVLKLVDATLDEAYERALSQ